ncbi:MAG: hypothetical protein NT069_03670 [Planctomycetota bacterium]|nr:hypothetical protein [Planctomycetota bacterium]
MKVKLFVARTGDFFAQSAGDVVDVSPREARRMVDSGQCVAIDDFPPEYAEPGSAKTEEEIEAERKAANAVPGGEARATVAPQSDDSDDDGEPALTSPDAPGDAAPIAKRNRTGKK